MFALVLAQPSLEFGPLRVQGLGRWPTFLLAVLALVTLASQWRRGFSAIKTRCRVALRERQPG